MSTSEDPAGGQRAEPGPPPAWDPPGQQPAGPYGQPPGAGPQYGQPAYGQPPGAGPQYGQPPGAGPQYGQPPGAGPQYGQPPYAPNQGWGPVPAYGGYGPPAQTEPKAVVAMVLSIVSFLVCPLVPAIVALVLASLSRRDIEASGGRLTGLGLVKAAQILSWVNIALVVLVVLVVAGFAMLGMSSQTVTTY